jgi:hypothetical protein
MHTIVKIKNFEGYEYNCSVCGRVIKHAYRLENDSKPIGSECIKAVAGFSEKKATEAVKKANSRAKKLYTLMTFCKKQYEEHVSFFGPNYDNMVLSGEIK